MKSDKVRKIVEQICKQRKWYILMYHTFPKRIVISNEYLAELYLNFLYMQNIPYDKVKTLFGMKIEIDNNIKKTQDIYVYQ